MEKLFRKPLSDRTKAEMIAGRLRVVAKQGGDYGEYADYISALFQPGTMAVKLQLAVEEGQPVMVNVTLIGKGGTVTVSEPGDAFPSNEFITKLILLGADFDNAGRKNKA